uniref:EF-hand domain-containing protein n=1 Tax=Salix viminalis TaxID=40686 RepID=A0A6N2LLI1_SALVM
MRISCLLIAVRKDYFRVINHRELLFNDCGDRVAQLLHVELAAPCSPCRNNDTRQEILIVNTHLLFPHDSSLSLVRLNQVYKILQYVESYQKENKLSPTPIMLCGDWNGSKRGHVYKFLRSQGFVSSYDTAHQYTDADAHKASVSSSTSKISEAILSPIQSGCLVRCLYSFVTSHHVNLKAVNLTGHCNGLSDEETKDLWVQADIDGNGVLDYKEFQNSKTIGFSVENAVLFPPEVEERNVPENYSLSDHASTDGGVLTNKDAMSPTDIMTVLESKLGTKVFRTE